MPKFRYWGIRPKSMPDHIRIEKSSSPKQAFDMAFGRGFAYGFQYKDFGTRVDVIQSNKKRIALCTEEKGWIDFPKKVLPS